jgi:hypothetical protein
MSFGQLSLRQVSTSVVSGRSDTALLAFWWSNSVHLRGFLQSLSLALQQAHMGGGPGQLADAAPKHWAAEVRGVRALLVARTGSGCGAAARCVCRVPLPPTSNDAPHARAPTHTHTHTHTTHTPQTHTSGFCAAAAAAGEVCL